MSTSRPRVGRVWRNFWEFEPKVSLRVHRITCQPILMPGLVGLKLSFFICLS